MFKKNTEVDGNLPKRGGMKLLVCLVLMATGGLACAIWMTVPRRGRPTSTIAGPPMDYQPRQKWDTSGFIAASRFLLPWEPNAPLREIGDMFDKVGQRALERVEEELSDPRLTVYQRTTTLLAKASLENYVGQPRESYQALGQARKLIESDPTLASEMLYSCIMFQGISSLRQGENENCILCRGESSCIVPISPAARHTNQEGSRRAIRHFMEYLKQFPEDLEVRWLLNVAHMTLGEYPDQVDSRFVLDLDHFFKSEFDIGKFRDIGEKVGLNRLNQAGGSIMDDFDNDGRLDIVTTSYDPAASMAIYRNDGQGRFENRSQAARVQEQLGGLNCMQTDYNNDGYLDVFIVRGAWLPDPVRPSLLRNNQDGTFTDVTLESGLLNPANSIAASWADYDNDGWLDLFVCVEKAPSRLYRNRHDGTFEDVTERAGLSQRKLEGKGSTWLDYDNDGHPDLFVNYLLKKDRAQLFRNSGDGTFLDVSAKLGIDGPSTGFACWAFDYDNDGWLDIFATCYERTVGDVVCGLQGKPHGLDSNRLFHNQQGQRFEDVTREAGLDVVLETMGCNYADFDNDGFLDMYLGTGEPELAALVPNRMFKNVAGKRFADITASSGTGNLQKGHAVACGDWNQDGNVDVFIEMGGAIPGDQYHNILFQNPGHDNNWLTVKLVGQQTNRAAIGARIKVVTSGDQPQTIHRHISSGSSFGANPLQQTIGLGKTERISSLEIHWPKTNKTQVFRDVSSNQAIEITESAPDYRKLNWEPIPVPAS